MKTISLNANGTFSGPFTDDPILQEGQNRIEITDNQASEFDGLISEGIILKFIDGSFSIFVPIPFSITAWQAKAALSLTPHPQAGTMLVAAEAALNAMPEGQNKIVVLSAWHNNANFERHSPTILSFGEALGMDSDSLDNLFRLGSSLVV